MPVDSVATISKSRRKKIPKAETPLKADSPIQCSHTRLMSVEALMKLRRENNPNTHPPEQLRLLGKIIQSTGWRVPIGISKRSGLITRGHGRIEAAALAGLKVAPVDEQDYETDEQEWADVLADNRIAELAELDSGLVVGLLDKFGGSFDTELMGFDQKAVDELRELLKEIEAPQNFPSVGQDIETHWQCPKCAYRWSGKTGGKEE